MAKVKTVPDPGDAGREKVNGPQPPSSDDALSGEREVRVDELHGTYTDASRTDEGVQRIAVMPLPKGVIMGAPRVAGVPTVGEAIQSEAEKHWALIEEARAQVVPAVETWATCPTCSMFTFRGGHGELLGQSVWCRGDLCPAYKGPGCCTMAKLGSIELLVSRTQPATPEELEELLKAPGARLGADTEARVQAKAGELASERAAVKRAGQRAVQDRDQQILDARRQERREPVIAFVRPGMDIRAAQEAVRRKALGG